MLTIVFSDLARSTEIKSRLPGADLTARNQLFLETILDPHRGRMEARLQEFGGEVRRFTGDSYLLVFREVLGAARWAAAVQRQHLTNPITTPLGPLLVRVGMHLGDPVVDPRFLNDFVGQEVDFAHRIMSLAEGGQITLSEIAAVHLRHALATDLQTHLHEERDLKGIGRVPVYELLYEGRTPGPLNVAALSPANLPPPPARCLGRDLMLIELRQRIHAGGVTALKAEGGMGKTTLALSAAWAALNAGELPGGVAWLNCETGPDLEECLRQSAKVFFGDRLDAETAQGCGRRILHHLRQTSALIVFDNFETVARVREILSWLQEVRPPARVLLTTREAPADLIARVVLVPELPRADSVRLFADLCTFQGRSTAGQEVEVGRICAAVGDHPLALELLSRRAVGLSLPRLLDRLTRDTGVLAVPNTGSSPDRLRSLQASFALSFDHLGERARQLLLETSVLPGGLGEEVLSGLWPEGDWDELAEELVAASLWRLQAARYTNHLLVRQWAGERLGERRGEAELRAIQTVIGLVEKLGNQLENGTTAFEKHNRIFGWFEFELANILACIEMARQQALLEPIVRAAYGLEHFLWVRDHWSDAERVYGLALDSARALGDQRSVGRFRQGQGRVYRHQGRNTLAEQTYQEAIHLLQECRDEVGVGRVWSELSAVYLYQNRLDEAEEAAQRGLKTARKMDDPVTAVAALSRLGVGLQIRNRLEEAEATHRECLALSREIGDQKGESRALKYLADISAKQKAWEDAGLKYEQSLSIARELGDRRFEANVIFRMGLGEAARQRWDAAEETFRRCLTLYEDFGNDTARGVVHYWMAKMSADRGRFAEALDRARQALGLLGSSEANWLHSQLNDLIGKLMKQSSATNHPAAPNTDSNPCGPR